jgi:hypothetical protein
MHGEDERRRLISSSKSHVVSVSTDLIRRATGQLAAAEQPPMTPIADRAPAGTMCTVPIGICSGAAPAGRQTRRRPAAITDHGFRKTTGKMQTYNALWFFLPDRNACRKQLPSSDGRQQVRKNLTGLTSCEPFTDLFTLRHGED